MGKVCEPRFYNGPVNAGEDRLLKFLEVNLPDFYYIIPNGEYPSKNPQGATQYYEYDVIVVAPHAIYNIENKDYRGRLEAYDNAWYHNDKEIPNPIKLATYKSKILSAFLIRKKSQWNRVWVDSLVTLSNLNQDKSGFEADSASDRKTFMLNDELISYITDPSRLGRDYIIPRYIAHEQYDIVDYLIGTSEHQEHKKTEVCGMVIDEILATTDDYIEYLCHKNFPKDKKYKVRDYALDRAGMSPAQLERHNKLVHNGEYTENYLPHCSEIISSEYREEENHYYVITPYQDDKSLRSEMARNTFTELDKARILLDVGSALSKAHEKNVIHRDVRPENIFIQPDRSAALANFGLAYNEAHEDADFNVTVDPESFGLDAYTSEDVAIGDYSAASDLYSFGVLAYELMTGKKVPFNDYLDLMSKGGVLTPEMMPTAINPNVEPWVDELCRRTIVLDSSQRWADIDEVREFIFNEVFTKNTQQGGEQPPTSSSLSELKPTDRITNDIVLGEQIGEGGFSKVFRAKHHFQPGAEYVAKIFKEGVSAQATVDEFKALRDIVHPNIVKFVNNGLTNGGLIYTLMDYVQGCDLRRYASGATYLPMDIVRRFIAQMLDALVYIQEKQPPIIHRDIKPENVIYNNEGNFVLIDFNIATDTEGDKHKVGTYRYLAPDLQHGNKMQWDLSADTFALGVTIYELLTHRYPWGSSQMPVIDKKPDTVTSCNPLVTDKFSEFVMKAIETRGENRFKSAKEMLDAFNLIPHFSTAITYLSGAGEEYSIVEYINSLYSQSNKGNAGTRASLKGDSLLDQLTYTQTKLDTSLLEDIKRGDYRLIIITGNAGDGKTAFIKRVEEAGEFICGYESGNGKRFKIGGVIFDSNYDGSQDEQNMKNNDVLDIFFRPFKNTTNYKAVPEGRIIAINEGRLMEYLESTPELKSLYDAIDLYFYKDGIARLPEGVMVINLNLRSVTAKDEKGDSLLKKQIKALTSKKLWTKCHICPLAERCFIKYNVDSLNDSAAGDEIIERLEWIVRTIVYKKELHITMRDLRSMIAWMITRDCSCEEVGQLIKELDKAKEESDHASENDRPDKRLKWELWRLEWWHRYYFNVTAPENKRFPMLQSEDRFIKLLRQTDIAQVAIPELDRNLFFSPKNEKDYLSMAERARSLVEEFNEYTEIRAGYDLSEPEIELLKMRHQNYVRHQYFEGVFPKDKDGFMQRLPFRSIGDFVKNLNKRGAEMDDVMNDLSYAISCSEGCWDRNLSKHHLLLSSSRIADPSAKSYRRFPLSDFEMTVDTNDKLTTYLEHESSAFEFRSKSKKYIQLNVSLELYEMLDYIKNGFSPSVSDLQGRFIELQVFKNLLESETYTEVIVTNNEKNYYKIRLSRSSMRIIIEKLKEEEA